MTRPIICFFAFVVLALNSTVALGIEATGEGSNQRQAINAALRQAIEMQLGTQVEANSLVENFQVVRQQILSHTQGYIKSYEILSESREPSGLVRITLKATVDNTSLDESARALETLMRMAANPRVFVAGVDDHFDAVSSINNEFRLLTDAVETILRDNFKFQVLDGEAVRMKDSDRYRHTDRRNNLKRAQRAGAAYVIFVEVVKNKPGAAAPLTLNLETLELSSNRAIAQESVPFDMRGWTRELASARESILVEAKDHLFAPTSVVAGALVENLRKEVFEDGQRFELSFQRFEPKFIEFLETDLKNLPGYQRHELGQRQKNALSLSYWSLLKAGPLHDEIEKLLSAQEITFQFSNQGQRLNYRFKDPFFE